jgi:hypothetical protein
MEVIDRRTEPRQPPLELVAAPVSAPGFLLAELMVHKTLAAFRLLARDLLRV